MLQRTRLRFFHCHVCQSKEEIRAAVVTTTHQQQKQHAVATATALGLNLVTCDLLDRPRLCRLNRLAKLPSPDAYSGWFFYEIHLTASHHARLLQHLTNTNRSRQPS
jgi:hypothetical protein